MVTHCGLVREAAACDASIPHEQRKVSRVLHCQSSFLRKAWDDCWNWSRAWTTHPYRMMVHSLKHASHTQRKRLDAHDTTNLSKVYERKEKIMFSYTICKGILRFTDTVLHSLSRLRYSDSYNGKQFQKYCLNFFGLLWQELSSGRDKLFRWCLPVKLF